MTTSDLSTLASSNLLRTYFALAQATPGSVVSYEEGLQCCLGTVDHPIANFAAKLRLDPWVAGRLVEIALSRPTFNVYSMKGDLPVNPNERDELLVRAGFRHNYRLRQMWAPPENSSSSLDLSEVIEQADREEVATFMANLFFPKYSGWFRRRVAEATSGATELGLFRVLHRDTLVGALMLVEDESMVGLFNLCVKPQFQSLGWGTSIVSEVKRRAYEARKYVSLQCEDSLTTWYENQGFESGGWIDVYALSDERRAAIII